MQKLNFNGDWQVGANANILTEVLGGPVPTPKTVRLPYDAMIHETPVKEAISGGQTGFYPGGEYSYVKKFDVPKDWEGKSVIVEFGGVYQIAKIYINGDFAGTNLHGYGGFDVKIDKYLIYGKENILKVVANNPDPNSRWYSGSGIYRNVNLYLGGEVHIKKDGIKITTKEADENAAVVEVETNVANISRKKHSMKLVTTVTDAKTGCLAAKDQVYFTVFSEENETLRQNIYVKTPNLWSPEKPSLYDIKAELFEIEREINSEAACPEKEESKENIADSVAVRTGIRTLSLDGKRGLRINGKSVKQRGTCIHHDNGILGAATFAAAEEKRAREIKAAGFNAIRSAHHPMSKEMLDACDKYGILVMDEFTDMWNEQKNRNDYSAFFDRTWEDEVTKMVLKDRNHPCVILYSTGNEILDLGRKTGGRINRRICNKFHELDPSRYTTTGVNGFFAASLTGKMKTIVEEVLRKRGVDLEALKNEAGDGEGGVGLGNMVMSMIYDDDVAMHPLMSAALEEAAQAADVAGYNYLTGRHVAEKDMHPKKPVLGTETYPSDIVRLWKIVSENDHVLGDYTWTGYDYLGEAGCGIFYYDGTLNFSSHFPDRAAYIGDINIIGYRRPVSYFRETVFGLRDKPYIGVIRMNRYGQKASLTQWMFKDNISSWTWPGYEGKETEVDIYSIEDEVELFLNGKSLGKKPCGKDRGFTATYKVNYEPGSLVAAAYKNGKETGRYELNTAKEEVILRAVPDRNEINAGGDDIAFVTVTLTDKEGNENLFAAKKVKVSVEGDGTLAAYGSAEPQPVRSYDDNEWETYDGQVMAAIRSKETSGKIKVTFSAEGCDDAVIEITSNYM
ncbi:MAG: DUF4982 domain-containing protein [Lachnospiraceae bacterium]|nr:DUF4982 domain-containing protein [Lachnospiraceae bacterium]